MTITSPQLRRRVRRLLLDWFHDQGRDLPWRRTRDPYPIWVSEIMLQQTQVATVIPYFKRFLSVFPTIHALAKANQEEVLRLWEGLGYYRRAQNLHRAARKVVAEHDGRFPRDFASANRLPGVGRYTAGAVLSQAYDCRLPILEANSRRVLARLLGMRDDPCRGAGQRRLWQAAEEFLPLRRPGDFNQSLMELGALVCTPSSPHCLECPLRKDCEACRLNLQEEIPAKRSPTPVVEVREVAVVVRRGKRVLIVQRPDHGRWANLWEFPHAELGEGEEAVSAAKRLVGELTGLRADLGAKLATIRHGVTRYRITMRCFVTRYRTGRFRSEFYQRGLWLEPCRLVEYPISSPQRRLVKKLLE